MANYCAMHAVAANALSPDANRRQEQTPAGEHIQNSGFALHGLTRIKYVSTGTGPEDLL